MRVRRAGWGALATLGAAGAVAVVLAAIDWSTPLAPRTVTV